MRPPRVMITDKLASYGAAKREIMPGIALVASRGPDRRRSRRSGPTPTRQTGCQAAAAQAAEEV